MAKFIKVNRLGGFQGQTILNIDKIIHYHRYQDFTQIVLDQNGINNFINVSESTNELDNLITNANQL